MKKLLGLVILTVVLLPGVNLAWAQSAARQAGYLYLSPLPGASYVSAQTRYVLVRLENVTPSEVTNLTTSFITVTGATSGAHSGVTHVATDGRTVIFEMSLDFTSNELVTVALNPKPTNALAGNLAPYSYQFMITAHMPGPYLLAEARSSPVAAPVGDPVKQNDPRDWPDTGPELAKSHERAAAVIMPNGVSVPSDFPTVVISVNSNTSPGYVFAVNLGYGNEAYWMILDNSGAPVWYRRGGEVFFQIQKNGLITMVHHVGSTDAYDQNFNFVRSYHAVNGYAMDSHEFKAFPDGTYLMLGYRENTVDMSQYVGGGATNATVNETIIQEFTAADELIFQWRAWDHYDVRDILGGLNLNRQIYFSHMNALEKDADGHLLVSSRELSEVTKINRDTGDIIWRLGGNNSSFSFVNDPLNGFSFQHDISPLSQGRYLVFDNGNSHSPQASRAVEYQLNLTNLTATLVWQFHDTPDKFTWVKGNAQRLPTGNTHLNFVQGNFPAAVEVDTNGVKRFELTLSPITDHYRTFRFPWNGVVAVPYLILEPDTTVLNLIFNKFGDTNVACYRIYGGESPQPTKLLATTTKTLKCLTNLMNGHRYYFRVTAVNAQGGESGYSNEETLVVNITEPGDQLVANGDFALGTNSWTWAVSGGAAGQWRITNGASYFDITNGGTTVSSLQFRQAGKPLIQGQKYVFEFDAWSQGPRYLEAKVAQIVSPFLNYSANSFSFVTPVRTHYRYVFTMQEVSDLNASVILNLGGSALDVYVDNLSLFNVASGDFNLDGRGDFQDLSVLTGNWLQQQPGLVSDLDGNGKVDFHDFAIFGENWSGVSP